MLYTKKQTTIQKLENFFINQKDLQADEVEELYQTLLQIYNNKDIISIISKALGLEGEALSLFIKATEQIQGTYLSASKEGQVAVTIEGDDDVSSINFMKRKGSGDEFEDSSGNLIRSKTYRYYKWGKGQIPQTLA